MQTIAAGTGWNLTFKVHDNSSAFLLLFHSMTKECYEFLSKSNKRSRKRLKYHTSQVTFTERNHSMEFVTYATKISLWEILGATETVFLRSFQCHFIHFLLNLISLITLLINYFITFISNLNFYQHKKSHRQKNRKCKELYVSNNSTEF